MVKRIYIEKKPDYAVAERELADEIKNYLGIESISRVSVYTRYDIENVSDETFKKAVSGVFSEPPVDNVYFESLPESGEAGRVFAVEYLPGQFDQRADSAMQCVRLLSEEEDPVIKSATVYAIGGAISDDEFESIKAYCINPVDQREAGMQIPETLITKFDEPADVVVFSGFTGMDRPQLKDLYDSLGLAMTFKDFLHIQTYFKNDEKRDPSVTEIRVLDTYWSDHCRHTTFLTELKNVTFDEGDYHDAIEKTYADYMAARDEVYGDRDDKFVCLMDLALIAMKKLKKEGKLDDQEESDEINACSIVVPVTVDGKQEEWLVNFKNETHNHPTEIEPFGGAATCLGGAIRDPLSGRTYVYQAMRVTGAADPTGSVKDTLKGKLPQKKLVRGAADGYSSYGNQIGLATGIVKEIYHPDYVAKRMEIGAVIGAAPRRAVKRLTSDPGDVIILLGGRTGRDGCGGATGSSKVHTEASIETCGAEVQKGNAPTERKLQRLFRREEVSSIIKKCNDFGAGGVSVAIGELADGLDIDLDRVPKKYAGLDGTEIAISESQERMAVVVDAADVEKFLEFSSEENLEATPVAVVTENPRLVMKWRGKTIVDISRAFLNTNGAHQETDVRVNMPSRKDSFPGGKNSAGGDVKQRWLETLSDLNVCSQKGLCEKFDGSIGAGSVFMPHGGKYQLTEVQTMVGKLPVANGTTDTVTMMSFGFDPYLSSWSPYHGAIYAVTESIAKIVATGGDYKKIRFTFQEYFRRMSGEPSRWSQPFSALLGGFDAQIGFGLPSIGGKDSMSGTFNDIDVPPTLVSFAVDVAKEGDIISPEFKTPGNSIIRFSFKKDADDKPVYEDAMRMFDEVAKLIKSGVIVSAYALDSKGIAAAVSKMAFGNGLGVSINSDVDPDELFAFETGNIIAEVAAGREGEISRDHRVIGVVTGDGCFTCAGVEITAGEALSSWQKPLEKVFPTRSHKDTAVLQTPLYDKGRVYVCKNRVARPNVFIPVFPGTNCEYDSARAFENAGASVTARVFKNLSASDIRESVAEYQKCIDNAQIIMFPGGFSAGDEPDGSAKFFATAFKNAHLKDAVERLLNERDGLALGICNGFQALIKLGLVPAGRVKSQDGLSPTLTYNTINRHVSKMVCTKVVSNKSPWLAGAELGGIYVNPASHGEGRFVAPDDVIADLFKNGQVATQYVNENGDPTMDEEWNVNGSYMAIEGITSADGRCFGKMAHVERKGRSVAMNIYGEQDMKVFESGVNYFK